MKLLVATDAHLYRTRDGAYYCNALYGYDYFTRYFAAFDAVRVVAREEPIASVPENWLRVDGEGVEVFGIPSFRGPKQLLLLYCRIIDALRTLRTDAMRRCFAFRGRRHI